MLNKSMIEMSLASGEINRNGLLPTWESIQETVMDHHWKRECLKINELRDSELGEIEVMLKDKLNAPSIENDVFKSIAEVWHEYFNRHASVLSMKRYLECCQNMLRDQYIAAGLVRREEPNTEDEKIATPETVIDKTSSAKAAITAKPSLDDLQAEIKRRMKELAPEALEEIQKQVLLSKNMAELRRRARSLREDISQYPAEDVPTALKHQHHMSRNKPRIALVLALKDAINRLDKLYRSHIFKLTPLDQLENALQEKLRPDITAIESETMIRVVRCLNQIMTTLVGPEEASELMSLSLLQLHSDGGLQRLINLQSEKSRESIRTQQEMHAKHVDLSDLEAHSNGDLGVALGSRRKLRKSINELYVLEPSAEHSLGSNYQIPPFMNDIAIENPIKNAERQRLCQLMYDIENFEPQEDALKNVSVPRIAAPRDTSTLSPSGPFVHTASPASSVPRYSPNTDSRTQEHQYAVVSVMQRIMANQRVSSTETQRSLLSLNKPDLYRQFERKTKADLREERKRLEASRRSVEAVAKEQTIGTNDSPSRLLPTPMSVRAADTSTSMVKNVPFNVDSPQCEVETDTVQDVDMEQTEKLVTQEVKGPTRGAPNKSQKPKRYLTLFKKVYQQSNAKQHPPIAVGDVAAEPSLHSKNNTAAVYSSNVTESPPNTTSDHQKPPETISLPPTQPNTPNFQQLASSVQQNHSKPNNTQQHPPNTPNFQQIASSVQQNHSKPNNAQQHPPNTPNFQTIASSVQQKPPETPSLPPSQPASPKLQNVRVPPEVKAKADVEPTLLTSSPVTMLPDCVPDISDCMPVAVVQIPTLEPPIGRQYSEDDPPTERVISKYSQRTYNSHTNAQDGRLKSANSSGTRMTVFGKKVAKNVVLMPDSINVPTSNPSASHYGASVASSVESSDQGDHNDCDFANATPIPMPIDLPNDSTVRKFMPLSQRVSLSPIVQSPEPPGDNTQ